MLLLVVNGTYVCVIGMCGLYIVVVEYFVFARPFLFFVVISRYLFILLVYLRQLLLLLLLIDVREFCNNLLKISILACQNFNGFEAKYLSYLSPALCIISMLVAIYLCIRGNLYVIWGRRVRDVDI